MLEACNLAVERGGRLLFEGLSFSVNAGQALQICGENGSGKSSLIKTLLGMLRATQGHVQWQNQRLSENQLPYQQNLLYIGHKPGVNQYLNAEQNLLWYLSMHEASGEHLEQAFKYFGLYGFEDIPAGKLSAGQQRRIALCRLMLEQKKLWILDEPLVSLDTAGVAALEKLISAHLETGGMAIFTSHQVLNIAEHTVQRLNLSDYSGVPESE